MGEPGRFMKKPYSPILKSNFLLFLLIFAKKKKIRYNFPYFPPLGFPDGRRLDKKIPNFIGRIKISRNRSNKKLW